MADQTRAEQLLEKIARHTADHVAESLRGIIEKEFAPKTGRLRNETLEKELLEKKLYEMRRTLQQINDLAIQLIPLAVSKDAHTNIEAILAHVESALGKA
jgi:hypothetical protein